MAEKLDHSKYQRFVTVPFLNGVNEQTREKLQDILRRENSKQDFVLLAKRNGVKDVETIIGLYDLLGTLESVGLSSVTNKRPDMMARMGKVLWDMVSEEGHIFPRDMADEITKKLNSKDEITADFFKPAQLYILDLIASLLPQLTTPLTTVTNRESKRKKILEHLISSPRDSNKENRKMENKENRKFESEEKKVKKDKKEKKERDKKEKKEFEHLTRSVPDEKEFKKSGLKKTLSFRKIKSKLQPQKERPMVTSYSDTSINIRKIETIQNTQPKEAGLSKWNSCNNLQMYQSKGIHHKNSAHSSERIPRQ